MAKRILTQVQLGSTFGRWTVIEEGQRSKHNQRQLLCECSCEAHTKKHVLLHSLLAGKSTGCTCVNRDVVKAKALANAPQTGEVFGRWTVVRPAGQAANGTVMCLCECSCAEKTQREVSSDSLKRGRSTSCGCYQRETATKHGLVKDRLSYMAKYQQDNKQYIAARKRAQRQTVPELVRLHSAQRRARKLQATPAWDQDLTRQRFIELSKQAKQLYKDTGIVYHVDHIIPLKGHSVCGLHVHNNLQLLPAHTNISKGNKLCESK